MRARSAALREAVGRGAHAELAFEVVPGDRGALREEGFQLPGADQGGCILLWYGRQQPLSLLR